MNLDKEEVVKLFCELASRVGSAKFNHTIPHDCFCEESNPDDNYFQFDEEVLDYIVESVNMRLLEDSVTTFYKVSDDSWWDGHEDCPCCSGMKFECYNAVDWDQNGSACSKEQLYRDILLDYVNKTGQYEDNPYEYHYEEELLLFMARFNIEVEWV